MKTIMVDKESLDKMVIFLVEKIDESGDVIKFCQECPAEKVCKINDSCCQMAWHIYLKDERWKNFL